MTRYNRLRWVCQSVSGVPTALRPGWTPKVIGSTPPTGWTNLLTQTFDTVALNDPLTGTQINSMLGDSTANNTSYATQAIVASDRGRSYRWHSPAGTYGNGSANGIPFFVHDPLAAYAAAHGLILSCAYEYAIKFPSNMDWSKGGKIPGPGGTSTSANPPTGGVGPLSTGFSCRSMWLTPTSGTFYGHRAQAPNEWSDYIYSVSQPDSYGENFWSGKSFIAGQWHLLRKEYTLNTITSGVGNPDGILRMYFDGVKVKEVTNKVYRSDPAVGFNRNLHHFFRGGADSSYVGAVDNDIMIDGLKIEVQ